MRDAACPAFERKQIGETTKSLRPSNKAHQLSAGWAPRRHVCGSVDAFGVHDGLDSGRLQPWHFNDPETDEGLFDKPQAAMRRPGK
jgi:hypothetical protein